MKKKFYTLISEKIVQYNDIIQDTDLSLRNKRIIKQNWLDFISLMEVLCKRHYTRYHFLNLTVIICGILVPVMINIIADEKVARIVATVLGILVSVAGAINQSYRFNDRWKHFRKISEILKIEGENFFP